VPSFSKYEIRFTKIAKRDVKRLTPKLKRKLRDILIEVLSKNPYQGKRLLGDLSGSYSYRLSYQDRIIYSIDGEKGIVYIERARTHYGD